MGCGITRKIDTKDTFIIPKAFIIGETNENKSKKPRKFYNRRQKSNLATILEVRACLEASLVVKEEYK
ncbi:hypothetical protein SteCoe_25891 [Stentor coeruleus]|uniref:Uncharacterized protein n=1 Tax=Stentor coeruleus TaxID=5963 RepID=A0A1R2BE48_9CILI|nr:hypothetical protein SteCoe_25891 [Stentor coeruleus]